MVLCTLFDSNYLDKGIALYESLERVTTDFTLYIFAFDKLCEDVLKAQNYKYARIVGYPEIEDEQLRKLKKERTTAEFCWTCSPIVIEYVLEKYEEESCTYIDADMYFFEDPNILYREIVESGCVVGIAPHRFKKDMYYRRRIRNSGTFCVHFNTFFNTEESIKILKEWKAQCIEWCYAKNKDGKYGDQLYLDSWPRKYHGVHQLQHHGGGVAPWNLGNYSDIRKERNRVYIKTGKEYVPVIFYHFEAIKHLYHRYIYMNLYEYIYDETDIYNPLDKLRRKKIRFIYLPYIRHIENIRKRLLKGYGIGFEHMVVKREDAKYYLPEWKKEPYMWLVKRKNVMRY